MAETIDWRPPPQPQRRRGALFLLALAGLVLLAGGTTLSYYVEALWYGSLGVSDVFWKTLNVRAEVFAGFAAVSFLVLYGSFRALKPPRLGDLAGLPIMINGQPIRLPVEPVIKGVALVASLLIAVAMGAGMMAQWPTLALYWYGRAESVRAAAGSLVDPIFGQPLPFYLFTLPAWQLVSGWVMTLTVLVAAVALFFVVILGGTRAFAPRRDPSGPAWRGLSIAFAFVLLALAVRVYLGRYDRLFNDHTIFSGVTYTDAHVTLTGLLVVTGALVVGAVIALVNAVAAPKARWLGWAVAPAAVCYVMTGIFGWYMNSFVVKPNELVRETPYITNNIEMTRQAYGLSRFEQRPFPAEGSVAALEADMNQATLKNIRLWDWRALQDTLRQIQEIRTYYDFPDIDVDRYEIGGEVRQMMVATRELNVERLPESSRNWINEKLIYTHGYGVTMNPVNGFTPEGLPDLILKDMPVQNSVPDIKVTRPEIYFGELTNTDVYVKTGQKEFNYPQGEAASLTSYEGTGGIELGGFFRRLIIALDRGDLAKLPFSDDISSESRLLMRRNIRARAQTLAPFLTYDDDPYIIIGKDGRLSWMMDAFTTSASFPYARHYRVGRDRINYLRNSVKVVIDAYDGSTSFYVVDSEDPVIAAYRELFPSLFKDVSAMPPELRSHMRYPELLLQVQAAVYGLYHMTEPGAFYNREDLWSIATEGGLDARRDQSAQPMEPNFVLMKLPGEEALEFIEILPFTPANRNNLIGWIAGRADGPDYGKAVVYHFPETRLVDGPLQIEARIDQNAQLSAQLSLWNQQGSQVVRGGLIVIPVGRALLYAEPIYLQAQRSPMPELRIVVLALQERLAYGPTFEAALDALFGRAPSTLASAPHVASAAPAPSAPRAAAPAAGAPPAAPTGDANALIQGAAGDLADYQRLTAEGKLGEAGQKLEALKQKLDALSRERR
jgi:uncharacterized membrane protein (UPF0182 family)